MTWYILDCGVSVSSSNGLSYLNFSVSRYLPYRSYHSVKCTVSSFQIYPLKSSHLAHVRTVYNSSIRSQICFKVIWRFSFIERLQLMTRNRARSIIIDLYAHNEVKYWLPTNSNLLKLLMVLISYHAQIVMYSNWNNQAMWFIVFDRQETVGRLNILTRTISREEDSLWRRCHCSSTGNQA